MTRGRLRRSTALTTTEQIRAVFQLPALYEIGGLIPDRADVGRALAHPGYLLLGYAALARVFRSGAKVEKELAQPAVWQLVRDTVTATLAEMGDETARPPGPRPPDWDAYRYARNRYLTDAGLLDDMRGVFTECAVEQARALGLLLPDGPGSLTHPDRSRTVYGDGTVVRPLYRPPAARRETDRTTGETRVVYLDSAGQPIDAPRRRFDPDAADYHGHAGPVHGNNFVALYVRGDAPHQRVVLAVDRVDRPGREADTAVALIKQLHPVVGNGLQAVVYDGAFRGRHIDDLMTNCGLIVVNKVAAQPLPAEEKTKRGGKKAVKWFPLGTWEHDIAGRACTHTLAAVDGAVTEIGLDDAGAPVPLTRLDRKQVKRSRRSSGTYHFNVAYEVPCTHGAFLAWVTPHGEHGDADARRAENVRVIAEGEPDFSRLYGLRNDAESFNAQYKRTLLVDRAMSLGAHRQLLDVLCFGLVNNAVTAHHAASTSASKPRTRRAA